LSVLILDADAVREALPMPLAIEAMRQAFEALSGGSAEQPPRTHLSIAPHDGVSLVMPAFVNDDDAAKQALAVKVVSLYGGNAAAALPRIQATVLVFDPATGALLALLDGTALTAIRTAAASAAATDLLARPHSRVLAVFGAGPQARAHVAAICAVRSIDVVRCYSRSRERADAMCAALSVEAGGRNIVAVSSPAEALADADIVVTATTSSTPVFDDTDLRAGVHINAIGSYKPEVCEIPSETVARAMVVVDSRAAAWEEAGDLIQPLRAGFIGSDHIHAELGEILLGLRSGRQDEDAVTLFKSVGVAVQDAVAARHAVQAARRFHLGKEVG
jgi:ornithine cyclodeaminase